MQEKTVYINFVDEINLAKVKTLIAVCTNIMGDIKPDKLYFQISSGGGDVASGISLYNYLKSLPVKLVMHNIGSIDSIANVIFVAAPERYAVPHSTFLFHGVQVNLNGPNTLSLSQVGEIKDRIENNNSQIAEIVRENSKLSEETLEKLFLQGATKGTDFALQEALIQEVRPAQIPQDSPVVTVNHQ